MEIKLLVEPAVNIPLEITVSENVLTYAGNLTVDNNNYLQPDLRGEVTLTDAEVSDLLGDIKLSELPAVPEFAMGCDGTRYTISFENGFNCSSFTWWNECPEEWRALEMLADRLIKYVQNMNQGEDGDWV